MVSVHMRSESMVAAVDVSFRSARRPTTKKLSAGAFLVDWTVGLRCFMRP